MVGRTISQPIKQVASAMRNIAEGEGDLTQRLDDSGRDELSDQAHQFNAFVSRMQATLLEVRGYALGFESAAASVSSRGVLLTRAMNNACLGYRPFATDSRRLLAGPSSPRPGS